MIIIDKKWQGESVTIQNNIPYRQLVDARVLERKENFLLLISVVEVHIKSLCCRRLDSKWVFESGSQPTVFYCDFLKTQSTAH